MAEMLADTAQMKTVNAGEMTKERHLSRHRLSMLSSETVNAGEMTKERNLSRHWLSMLPSDATLHEMYVSIASIP